MTCPTDITIMLRPRRTSAQAVWQAPRASYGDVSFNIGSTHNPGDFFFEGTTQVTYTAIGAGPNGLITVSCLFFVTIEAECDEACCGLADGVYTVPTPAPMDCFAPPELDAFEGLFRPTGSKTCFDGHSICDQPRTFLPRRPPRPFVVTPKFFLGPAEGSGPIVVPPSTTTTTMTTSTTSTTSTTTTTATLFAERCQGRTTDTSLQACSCGTLDDCHTCGVDVLLEPVVGTCELCKNEAYLHEGACVASCPSGFVGTGTGRFGRTCVPIFVEPVDEQCIGTLTTETEVACRCGDDCYACDWSGVTAGDCSICKNGQHLLRGQCISSCPSGYTPTGTGNFRRECISDSPTTSPAPATDFCVGRSTLLAGEPCVCNADCHTCEWDSGVAGECVKCKNEKALLDGACVDSCPPDYDLTGSGSFGRECALVGQPGEIADDQCEGRTLRDAGTACRCANDCHTCAWVDGGPSTCTLCKNAAYLSGGECVQECPSGTTAVDRGNFGSECVSSRRRSILALADPQLSASERVAGAAASPLLLMGVVVAVLGLAVAGVAMVVHRRVRNRTLLPTHGQVMDIGGTVLDSIQTA